MDQEPSAAQDGDSVIVGGYLNWHIRSKEGRQRWTPEQATPRIKGWRLKEENPKIKFRETVLVKVRPMESVHEWWEEHDDFESRTRGVDHYRWAEIPRR